MFLKKKLLLFLSFSLIFVSVPTFASCDGENARDLYQMDLQYDPVKQTLCGVEKVTYHNTTQNEISTLPFELYANAYRKEATFTPVSSLYRTVAYYDGESYGSIDILQVEGGKDFTIGGEDENILYVNLENSLFPEEEVTVTITFSLTLANIDHRLGVTKNVVNFGNFYPILCAYEEGKGFCETVYYSTGDPFYSQCADYKVTLTLPEEYTAVASGAGESVKKDGSTTYSYCLENRRDFALAVSKENKLASREVDGVTVTYFYEDEESVEDTLDVACRALSYFSQTFGTYQYSTLTLVQTGFCYGGMEYPALALISDSLNEKENLYTVVHEIAHQWWYSMVGNDQCNYAWMDEGLAEYSTVCFLDGYEKYGQTRQEMVEKSLNAYQAYVGVYGQIFGQTDVSMSRNLSTFISEYEYVNLVYRKGVLLFDTLRKGIGDKRFFQGLKSYFQKYQGKEAVPEQLIECFCETGVDVEGLFNGFVGGNGEQKK